MTREELKRHCLEQIEGWEKWAKYIGEPYRKIYEEHKLILELLEQEPTDKCKWIKYDHRTMCPKEHDVDSPYWRIPESRMETLKYCPYCGKEIEVEE